MFDAKKQQVTTLLAGFSLLLNRMRAVVNLPGQWRVNPFRVVADHRVYPRFEH
jgi:hypothetical protein